MNKEQILALHCQEQRQHVEYPGTRREVLPELVRHINLRQPFSFISYSHLTPDNADAVIQAQIDYYRTMQHSFEWKHYAYDTPSDLPDRLLRHGFTAEETEAFVVLDTQNAPAALKQPVTLDIRRLTNPAAVYEQAIRLQEIVWEEEMSSLADELPMRLHDDPDNMFIFVGYVDDQPVSSAWVQFIPGHQFVGLWGGSTLAAYRGRGFYKALVAVRLQEALRRGVPYLTVDASPMSRPILERLGFEVLTYTTPYVWEPT